MGEILKVFDSSATEREEEGEDNGGEDDGKNEREVCVEA